MRKEPFQGAVSTLEAVARALSYLEDDVTPTNRLLDVLTTMVSQQKHCDGPELTMSQVAA